MAHRRESIVAVGHTANDEVLAAAALARLLAREPAAGVVDPWDIPDGWRVGGRAWTKFRFAAGPERAAREPWPRSASGGWRRQARRSR